MRHQHKFYKRDDGVCHCMVCNCVESELTTQCPEKIVPPERRIFIAKGQLDYFNKGWWTPLPPEQNVRTERQTS